MHDLQIFISALNGDDGDLRSLAGPLGIVCVAPDLSSVFLIETAVDGTQRGTLAIVSGSGGAVVKVVPLPRTFTVHHIGHDSNHFTLTSTHGRIVYGRPQQFSFPKLIPEEHNPSYQAHLEEAFLATHLLPDGRSQRDAYASISEPMLGGTHVDDLMQGSATVRAANQALYVDFDSSGPEKVTEQLPHARRLVAAFETIRRDGTEFLWTWGSEGDERQEEKTRFLDEMRPSTLVIYRSGDFEVHFDVPGGCYFQDGYWPAVLYRADMSPVAVTVEA